jgi:hypothetical protein
MNPNGVPVPPDRAQAARDVAVALTSARHVVLTTHADGDGVGSRSGCGTCCGRGRVRHDRNPTGIPDRFQF